MPKVDDAADRHGPRTSERRDRCQGAPGVSGRGFGIKHPQGVGEIQAQKA
jgi:hypothetical protein